MNLEVWHLIAVFELPFGLEEMAGVNKFKGWNLPDRLLGFPSMLLFLYVMVSKTSMGRIGCAIIAA